MSRTYVKPEARLLDRTVAVSVGGCGGGSHPGACGEGFSAGTCSPGSSVGVSYCTTGAAVYTYLYCGEGFGAKSGCNVGHYAMF